jgi:hypothetical protein
MSDYSQLFTFKQKPVQYASTYRLRSLRGFTSGLEFLPPAGAVSVTFNWMGRVEFTALPKTRTSSWAANAGVSYETPTRLELAGTKTRERGGEKGAY